MHPVSNQQSITSGVRFMVPPHEHRRVIASIQGL
jgi:hypothetical protein